MDRLKERLTRCFSAVFPELSPAEIESASPETVPTWDSIANLTLITVVEQEFATEIPIDDLELLRSFELILDYLRAGAEPA